MANFQLEEVVQKSATIEPKDLLLSLEQIIEDVHYRLNKARSPKAKRQEKKMLAFYSSIYTALKEH